jgi:hypothetical protein
MSLEEAVDARPLLLFGRGSVRSRSSCPRLGRRGGNPPIAVRRFELERLLGDLKNLAHLLERHVELFLNATYRFGVLSVQSNVHESSPGKFPLGPGLKFTEQKSQMEHP